MFSNDKIKHSCILTQVKNVKKIYKSPCLTNEQKASIFFRHLQPKIVSHMRARLIFFLILTGLWFLNSCKTSSEEKVNVSGTFTNIPSAKLYIYQLLPESKPLIDSVKTDTEGNFNIAFVVKQAGFYTLKLNATNEITLVVSPGENIILKGDGTKMRKTYSVEGSADSKLYAEYIRFTNSNLEKVDSMSRIFAESRERPDFIALKHSLDSAYLLVFNDQREKVISFVNNHLNSLASLLVISENFGPNQLLTQKSHPDLFLKLDSTLMLTYPENPLLLKFHQNLLALRAELADIKMHDSLMQPGMYAPDIILNDAKGKQIKFSSLKKRLKLVYFWSSSDAESRQINMKLSTLFSEYYTRGFMIYGVSVDTDPSLWQNAYLIDRTMWIQVNDPKGLASEYSKIYGVRAIPYLVLVGKDGKIIARNPEFEELEELVQKNI
jgi:peroxiredoxin